MPITINRGKQKVPFRLLVWGIEGIGKSTFAAKAPAPVFIAAENGVAHLDVASVSPTPTTFPQVLSAIDELSSLPDSECGTIVVDPINWIEPLIWAEMCRANKWENIEEPGYGKGYALACEPWRKLVKGALESAWLKGKHVILLGHSDKKRFSNPEGPDYDRFQLSVNDKAYLILKQWCDAVLFARYDSFAHRDKTTKKVIGTSTGERVLYTQWRPAFDAKNRYGLPDKIPLDWDVFLAAASQGASDPLAPMKSKVDSLLADLGDTQVSVKTNAWLLQHGATSINLSEVIAKLSEKLEKAQGIQPYSSEIAT